MRDYLRLFRVKHYIKNVFIFTTLIFGAQVFTNDFFKVLVGFVSFSIMSSAIYILNDLIDYNIDKITKTKKDEPIASNRISKKKAIVIMIILILLSLIINYFTSSMFSYIFLVGYLILNIFYSFIGKKIPYIELLIISLFYLIRVFFGAAILNVSVSLILILTVVFGSLYIIIMKRIIEQRNKKYRQVFKEYNNKVLRILSIISLILVLIAYFIWTIIENIPLLVVTNILIIFIFIRYDKKIIKSLDGNPVELICKDKLLLTSCLLYGVLVITLIEIYL